MQASRPQAPIAKQQPVMAQQSKSKGTDAAAYSGYFESMFSSPTTQAQDDISADSIGSQHEQKYFQDEHSGHAAASYPYDSYSTYYESMFADAH